MKRIRTLAIAALALALGVAPALAECGRQSAGIYGSSRCAPCRALNSFLASYGVALANYEEEQYPWVQQYVESITGRPAAYPTVVIDGRIYSGFSAEDP